MNKVQKRLLSLIMIQAIIVNFSIPTFADELGNFDIQPLTPTENMFVFTSPENTVYDGTYMSNLPPIDAGTYSVLIDLSDLTKKISSSQNGHKCLLSLGH